MKTRIFFLGLVAGLAAAPLAATPTATLAQSGGWFEEAYVKWTAANADSFAVYCTGGGFTNKQIDAQLIRSYGSYWRADVPGLAPGSYTLKVVPYSSGTAGTATTTGALTVTAFDRSGFAFSGGRVPGAYKTTGVLKDSAVILYLSEKNKDALSLSVKTGSSKYTVFTGIQNILDGFNKGYDNRPLDIRVIGQVTPPTTSADGDILLENGQSASGSITLEGIGNDATANRWGVRIKNASNVEVRNLGIMNVNSTAGDDIGLQQDNDHIWVHNNDHFYGDAGSDADQVKGDGAMDVKLSTYITIAYDHFWDNGKSSLLGLKENTDTGYYITYHHNWFDHSDSRHPRVRFYSAHIYNNYYDGNSKYGAGSTDSSSLFLEANYFRNCKYPMMISLQGSDVWDESTSSDNTALGTFSSEVGGMIKAYDNVIDSSDKTFHTRFVPYGDAKYPKSTVDFDAYVVTSRTATVPATVKSYSGSNIYNNFDVNSSIMYSYTADSPADARAKDTTWAGRLDGGDFRWTFVDSVDDTAHAVNAAFKAAVVAYTSSVAYIQGIGTVGTGTTSVLAAPTARANPILWGASANLLRLADGYELRSAEIFTPGGTLVKKASCGSTSLSLGDLSNGVYLAKVSTNQGVFEKAFLKTK
jgi:pectate lyase